MLPLWLLVKRFDQVYTATNTIGVLAYHPGFHSLMRMLVSFPEEPGYHDTHSLWEGINFLLITYTCSYRIRSILFSYSSMDPNR